MKSSSLFRTFSLRNLGMILASCLFILSAAGAFIQHEEEKQSAIDLTKTTDWLLVQVQRETMRLQSALNLYAGKKDPASKDKMLLHYEILLSRFTTPLVGEEGLGLRSVPSVEEQFIASQRVFLELDSTFFNLSPTDEVTIDKLRKITGDHEHIFNKLVQRTLVTPKERAIVELTKVRSLTSLFLSIMCLSGLALIILLRMELKRSQHHADMEHHARILAVSQGRAKTNFLSHMSHELRTPLNAIIGYSEVMDKEILGPLGNKKYKAYTKDIITSSHNLLDLISDILNISKIEVENYKLQEVKSDLFPLIENSMILCQSQATKRNVTLSLTGDFQKQIFVDPLALKQIMINLINNAIRFSPQFSIVSIGITVTADQDLEIYVKDSGPGIDESILPRLFQPFDNLEPETSNEENWGLGLFVSRLLIELHDGTIEAKNNEESGACFIVKLSSNRYLHES